MEVQMNFDMALAYVLQNEGGWTIDDGGWTMYGITVPDVAKHRNVPEHVITEQDMRNLGRQEARDIYREQYWNQLNLDQVNDLGIATCIFDTGVNRGIGVAARYAQKICNLGLPSLGGPLLVVDGAIGSKTIDKLNVCRRDYFITQFEALEMAGYHAIVASNPAKYQRYEAGWEARARRLLTLV